MTVTVQKQTLQTGGEVIIVDRFLWPVSGLTAEIGGRGHHRWELTSGWCGR